MNVIDNKFCSKCSYPLTPQAYEEIKANEDAKLRALEEKYEYDIKLIRKEMESKFQQIITKIDASRLS